MKKSYYEVYARRYIGNTSKTEVLALSPDGLVEIVFVLEDKSKIAVSVSRQKPSQLYVRASNGRLTLHPLGATNVLGIEVEHWQSKKEE